MRAVLKKVSEQDLIQLHQIVVDTFTFSFAHLNNPEDFNDYVDQKLNVTQIEEELANPDSLFYFVLIDASVKGYLKLNRLGAQTEQYIPNGLEVERIYLLPEGQGFGVGKLMLDKAKAVAREEHYTCLWLGVWEENDRAISFYKREGFEAFDKHIFMLGSDPQVDLMMKMEL